MYRYIKKGKFLFKNYKNEIFISLYKINGKIKGQTKFFFSKQSAWPVSESDAHN